MTNLEGSERNAHEKETDLADSAGDPGHGRVHRLWRRNRAAIVELAGAVAVWLEADYFLAGAGAAGALPHPVWRIRPGRRQWQAQMGQASRLARKDGRALREHEPRGTRKVPRKNARTLGLWSGRRRRGK